jgi:hypothetical protein
MKIQHLFFALILPLILSACAIPTLGGSPPALPDSAVTSAAPANETPLPIPTATATLTATASRTPSITPTQTFTRTPSPTRKSPFPVGFGTTVPDPGFPVISLDQPEQLQPVFKMVTQSLWHSALSRDGKQLFAATSNGMIVYDRQGKQLAAWPNILMYNRVCESCLSVNQDGSRFALATRKDGKWEIQIYNVDAGNATLVYAQPMQVAFQNIPNEIDLALSPDGFLLAYDNGDGNTFVVDLRSLEKIFTYEDKVDTLIFTPDGASLAIRHGRNMLFLKTATWKNPTNLLLPAEDSPYAFSPDGKLIAVAVAGKVRAYTLDKLSPKREISVPPASATNRVWQIVFEDDTILLGYGIRWNGLHTKATVDAGKWNLETGETLKMETSESDSPDSLSALWGAVIPATATPGELEIGQYQRFSFVTPDSLLINGIHTACWFKLSTGEKNCFNDPKNNVLASDTSPYREIIQSYNTLLQKWNGGNAFDVGPYRIAMVNKNADYIVLNVNDATTDIYYRAKKSPVESIPGRLLSYAENSDQIVLSTHGKSTLVNIAVIAKNKLDTLYQKKDTAILKPLAITNAGVVYFLQQPPDQAQVTLKMIDAKTYAVTDVMRLSMPAEPQVMAIAQATGLFAFGLQDGSVMLVSPDGTQTLAFQPAYSSIGALAFSADGRYLAIGSLEMIKIFAIVPERK